MKVNPVKLPVDIDFKLYKHYAKDDISCHISCEDMIMFVDMKYPGPLSKEYFHIDAWHQRFMSCGDIDWSQLDTYLGHEKLNEDCKYCQQGRAIGGCEEICNSRICDRCLCINYVLKTLTLNKSSRDGIYYLTRRLNMSIDAMICHEGFLSEHCCVFLLDNPFGHYFPDKHWEAIYGNDTGWIIYQEICSVRHNTAMRKLYKKYALMLAMFMQDIAREIFCALLATYYVKYEKICQF